ncbi:UDP-N-acetylglucosamine 1-carboxyvinyltransferase [Tepidibacillus fermentans]|uniref:UDP-N-acetylglucosamine 1-carboxyvinyltransferase n=1 Tax=Tepidibacillus fermentans TaxID=1281767 RepID=A0A4R3KJ73_9BACI|nr:UDP-N-acetylglucosamine 1-carboxyvinyltransferase [Tepidibacillus fermentans]TCS83387.1 UDP-N-acetylglucosamine 1-carboxyvinyltransferase [Tepidibacillus fermentans]
MGKIIVRGGRQLSGRVKADGAKNAVLPILAASILGQEGVSTIYEVPALDDVYTIIDVLSFIGVDIRFQDGIVTTNAAKIQRTEAPYDLVRKMRASFLVMGPLLAREGHARIALPGGCAIGSRPVDLHLKGFEAMGAKIHIGQGYIDAKVDGRLKGAKIYLDYASVGATENIIMAAVLAEGTTVIENAAQEPEIVDLANFLNSMGAKVRGAGTGTIRIDGVDQLTSTRHSVIPDRIEIGTYMVAAAITGGDILIENAITDHLKPVIAKLEEMGVMIEEEDEGLRVRASHPLKAIDIKTLPHPGFPTDMQSQMMALLLTAQGTSIITETVFENRFMHVEEFKRMNANIKIEGRTAIIEGNAKLVGTRVEATDLRAGAALVLAGLVSEGETEVTGLHHIDRGYVDLVGKLKSLGADIERIDEKENTTQELQPLWVK